MRHVSKLLPGALLAILMLCFASVTATAAVRANGNDKIKTKDGEDNGAPAARPPAESEVAPSTPPGQAKKTTPNGTATAPGQAKKTTPDASATSSGGTKKGSTGTPATPARTGALIPVPPATTPVLGKSMGLEPVSGAAKVRLPGSSGYVSLATAGSIPSGAVVDARRGTVVLRSAVDADGGMQGATIRGAIFEVRQSASADGMTDLVMRGGRPRNCRAGDQAATARAAVARATPSKRAKPRPGALWARDNHGRFRTRGRNSVATVRGTRWSTRETCAGTITRVMAGAVDVFDLRTQRTVRVRAGHAYLARTSR